MRRAAKRDSNDLLLAHTARQMGALMVFLGEPVDWLCGWQGRWFVVEVKNPEGRDRYTDNQVDFFAKAGIRGLPVWTWRDRDDVIASLSEIRP